MSSATPGSLTALASEPGRAPRTDLKPPKRTKLEVCVRPALHEDAFANPLKGFRTDLPSDGGDGKGLQNPLITLARHYIRWNQIENAESDTVAQVRDFCEARWEGVEKRNLKIVPRVYLYWPEKFYWPADLRAGDYGSTRFLDRLGKLISKLGEAWDRDPRVAYVETGIVGPCGEQWGPTPHFELKRVIGEAYRNSFRHKLCMVRYPWQWVDYSFGVFWDSWGTRKDTARMLEALESSPLKDSWKNRVRGGEISYGFGEPPGEHPNQTMTDPGLADWVECLARRGHWNHLGWVSEYDWRQPGVGAQEQRLQKAFGYRFCLEEVTFPVSSLPGERIEVRFAVRNTGSSPFYYEWPVALCLLEDKTRKVVWQECFNNLDIRKWLPGDVWQQFANWSVEKARFVLDGGEARYGVAPEVYREASQFVLPRHLTRGHYVLCLGILDPAGMVPACRFATRNYFQGGWHPIGRIAIAAQRGKTELDSSSFDSLTKDTSIHYAKA